MRGGPLIVLSGDPDREREDGLGDPDGESGRGAGEVVFERRVE